MKFLFWVFTGLLLAVITHLSYVLFVPRAQFGESIEVALKGSSANNFIILDQNLQSSLMPFTAPHDLVGLCRFDLKEGPIKLSVEVTNGYWEFAVYAMGGQQVYALNDKQAGTNSFNVTLSKAVSIIDQVSDSGASDEAVGGDIGWRVELNDTTGVAFLWMPHGDKLRRAEAELMLKKSKCGPVIKP